MNGFLVILRCSLDDVPLALFATQQEANEWATEFDPSSESSMEHIWNIEATTRICVDIVRFRGGVPDFSYTANYLD